jgi:hypothetical protein
MPKKSRSRSLTSTTSLAHVVDVVGRNHPSTAFRLDGAPSLIRGAPARVSRAVSNLIDNAAKWSARGAEVETPASSMFVTDYHLALKAASGRTHSVSLNMKEGLDNTRDSGGHAHA